MNNIIKTSIISVIGAVVVVVIGFSLYHPTIPTPKQTIVKGTSPEISSPYLTVNGVSEYYVTQQFAQSTSTVCAIASPLIGSSTLQYVSVHVTANTNPNTLKFDIATATTPFATTTILTQNQNVVALQPASSGWIPATFIGSEFSGATTTSVAYNGQYINVQVGTSSSATNPLGYTGFCQAEFTAY